MGSPGFFIHSGILGGRLSAFSVAATASLPARPPAAIAPPTNTPPSRRKRRRDVRGGGSVWTSVGSGNVRPPFESGARRIIDDAGEITGHQLPLGNCDSEQASAKQD